MNNQTQDTAEQQIEGDAADQANEIALKPGADNAAATEEALAGSVATQEAETPKEDTTESSSATVGQSISGQADASIVDSTTVSAGTAIMPNSDKPVEPGSAEHISRLKR